MSHTRLRTLLLTVLLLILALGPSALAQEAIELRGGVPVGETLRYDIVALSNLAYHGAYYSDEPRDPFMLPPAHTDTETSGSLIVTFEPVDAVGRHTFSYGIEEIHFRQSIDYRIWNGVLNGKRYPGVMSRDGTLLLAAVDPILEKEGLRVDHILPLIVFNPPEGRVQVGDSWTRSSAEPIPGTPGGFIEVTARYTLIGIDPAGFAQISADIESVALYAPEPGGRTERVAIQTFGTFEVGLETGNVAFGFFRIHTQVTTMPSIEEALSRPLPNLIQHLEYETHLRLILR